MNENNSSKDSIQTRYYKKENKKKMNSISKKLHSSITREKLNSGDGDISIQGKNSRSDIRITNSTSCNSF